MSDRQEPAARYRAPNGAAPRRVMVSLPPALLDRLLGDAEKNMRTASAMAAVIITAHYQAQEGK